MQRYHDVDKCKSYATEANLEKALAKLFPDSVVKQAFIVCNREGRFTAVFPVSAVTPDVCMASRLGFMTMG